MFLKILDEKRINLLTKINNLSFINNFKMGGGTALSLQLGLRKSYDFDFFTNNHFNPDLLYDELSEVFGPSMKLIEKESRISTLNLFIDDIQVSFFEYKYPDLDKKIIMEGYDNIFLLSVNDIACMKSVALVQRGTKKDFFDLYFILKSGLVDGIELKTLLENKYHDDNLITNFCYSLVYFSDAENDTLPEAYVDYSWEKIKLYFVQFQEEFIKLIK